MWVKLGVPILAAAALGFGVATTMILRPEEQLGPAPNPPAISSIPGGRVAGLGEIQPVDEPARIGTALAGVVKEVLVLAGDRVEAGQPLFAIDDRELRAELRVRERTLAAEEARLARARSGTRPEDVLPARARVEAARVALERAQDQLDRGTRLDEKQAISREEMQRRRFAMREAQAEARQAAADLARLEAGTWAADLAIVEREVDLARANVDRVKTELERLVVRAPFAATVLRVDVRPGEFADSGPTGGPLVVLARSGPLQVRVQVDEEDASRVVAGAAAEGFLRGRDRVRVGLRFVRIEPRVVPKTSLTGGATERVDTRVLFVVYELLDSPARVYAGQKLDVFIAEPQHTAPGAPAPGTSSEAS